MKKWKRLLGSNFKQVLFVFGAFVVMVLIGCLSVSAAIQREVRTSVSIALKETEKTIKSYLHEPQIAFTGLYTALRDMLDRGDSQEAVHDYLSRMGAALGVGEEGVSGFTGVYGYIRDEFIDSINLKPGADFIPRERPWYQAAAGSRTATYTAPYVDAKTGKVVISLAREVYGKAGEYYGVLAIDVDLSWLFGYARSLQFAPGGYGMILNQHLRVITHPEERFINSPLEGLGADYAGVAAAIRESRPVSDLRIRDFDGSRVVVFFRELDNGWHIGVVMPRGSYYAELYRAALFLVVLGVVLASALSLLLLRLSAAKMRSDEDSRAKSSFLARMSHEIRTPLNAIIGLSDIQMRTDLPESTRDDLEKIHASGRNLLGIINDILDFSKIDAGAFTLAPVDYDSPSLVNDTIQMNLAHTDSRPVAFVVNVSPNLPAKLRGDELRLKQILNNLLSNAFKYTREGSVTFTVLHEPRDGCAVLRFTVADTGMGIREADMDNLFSEYTRLNADATRKLEGTGLGLVIAKGLAESMGGEIRAESEYGRGSTFSVSIPQVVVDATPIGREVAENLEKFRFTEERRGHGDIFSPVAVPDARVLVVDDIPTNLDVARGMLSAYRMRVDCAGGGREAVDRIRDERVRYDAVFMDHMMPEVDGVEATRIIREEIATEYARTIPIIALTANALAGNEEMFLAKGFNAFVSKPIDPKKLDAVVRRWVARPAEARPKPAPVFAPDAFAAARLDGVDMDDARLRYGGVWDIYADVLGSFAKHTPRLLAAMSDPTPETLPEYAVTVHGLKGSCWGIGAKALGEAAAELERAAKAGEYGAVASGNGACLALAEKLVADIDALLRGGEEGDEGADCPAAVVAAEPDRSVLASLAAACGDYDLPAMERALASLESRRYERGGELVAWLREQVDGLEYDAVSERLEALSDGGDLR